MILEIIILVLAFPAGYLVAWMARDELIAGRKWFKTLIIIGLVLGLFFAVKNYKISYILSFFIVIVSFISYKKSFDKKWIKRRT